MTETTERSVPKVEFTDADHGVAFGGTQLMDVAQGDQVAPVDPLEPMVAPPFFEERNGDTDQVLAAAAQMQTDVVAGGLNP